jgi:(p)ppGpp synthase/HD superfamily hydrolase
MVESPPHAYAQTNTQLLTQLHASGWPADGVVAAARAYELATTLFCNRFRGSGRPFLAHLVGTASVLGAHGASREVVIAGLLHGAYAHGDFGTGSFGVTPAKRQELQDAIGSTAEGLIAAYGDVQWHTWAGVDVVERFARLSGEQREAIPIVIANEIEEALDLGLAYLSETRRADGLAGLGVAADLAELAGMPKLRKEALALAAATLSMELPPELCAGRNGSYSISPRDGEHASAAPVALLRSERERANAYEAQVDWMTGSLSWRLTGPLRRIAGRRR